MPAFQLPETLIHKSDQRRIAADELHFAAIARSLGEAVEDLTERLDAERRASARHGQAAMDRDLEVHRLSARLRTLRRFSLDLCLGRVVPGDGGEPLYVGRLGLTSREGRQLLVDWRSPAAEPFFAATPAHPMGLSSRRRYRWTGGVITDYWDEALSGGVDDSLALDEDSAFIAGLAASRSPRMRDVLGTIQADQDAIIRADSRGALVIDGGPGTGKTVVALHRAAYLLHADPRLGPHRGGVLFVGPHQPYLNYVADVLPSLGEEGVQTCTLRDLVPEGVTAAQENDPEVARLKSTVEMVAAIEPAVAFHEDVPTQALVVDTPWGELRLSGSDWAEAWAAPDPGTPHNEAREEIREALVEILLDKYDGGDAAPEQLCASLLRNGELNGTLNDAWPLIEATDLVGDLWEVPAYLRLCAPHLDAAEVRLLQRSEPRAWTDSDLPLLDAARQRLGDPSFAAQRRRREMTQAVERQERDKVVEHLIADDDSEMKLMSMLRGVDLQGAMDDPAVVPTGDPDLLAGPFAHVVVDEAQELTDAQWQMVLRRCPSRSLTLVGDRAQARHGFAESWTERLERVGAREITMRSLTVNYRTPAEVMEEAAPVIRAALPDANVPTSIRTGGRVRHAGTTDLAAILDEWLSAHAEGTACVIGDPSFTPRPRVQSLSPTEAKGLEFDLVVLVDPDSFGDGIEGAVDRYVAMTRATQQLVVLG